VLQHRCIPVWRSSMVSCRVLQCVAVCTSALKCAAVCCGIATHCNRYSGLCNRTHDACCTLQHTATHCNTLQHTATGTLGFAAGHLLHALIVALIVMCSFAAIGVWRFGTRWALIHMSRDSFICHMHVTHKFVMSHMNESCYIGMDHVTYE